MKKENSYFSLKISVEKNGKMSDYFLKFHPNQVNSKRVVGIYNKNSLIIYENTRKEGKNNNAGHFSSILEQKNPRLIMERNRVLFKKCSETFILCLI